MDKSLSAPHLVTVVHSVNCTLRTKSTSKYLLYSHKRILNMNSMKLVIPLHSLYWSIHTKDESSLELQ